MLGALSEKEERRGIPKGGDETIPHLTSTQPSLFPKRGMGGGAHGKIRGARRDTNAVSGQKNAGGEEKDKKTSTLAGRASGNNLTEPKTGGKACEPRCLRRVVIADLRRGLHT